MKSRKATPKIYLLINNRFPNNSLVAITYKDFYRCNKFWLTKKDIADIKKLKVGEMWKSESLGTCGNAELKRISFKRFQKESKRMDREWEKIKKQLEIINAE